MNSGILHFEILKNLPHTLYVFNKYLLSTFFILNTLLHLRIGETISEIMNLTCSSHINLACKQGDYY